MCCVLQPCRGGDGVDACVRTTSYTVGDKFYIMFNGTADIYFKGEGAAVNRVTMTDGQPQAFAQLSANRRRAELGRHVKTVLPGDSFGDVALRQVRTQTGSRTGRRACIVCCLRRDARIVAPHSRACTRNLQRADNRRMPSAPRAS